MENVDKIEKILRTGYSIKNGIKRYKETIKDPRCDKHNMKFNGDSRFSSAKVIISVDSYTGYYSSSSCSTFLSIPDENIFKKHFVDELNSRFDDIMNSVADRIIKEAVKYQQEAEKELTDKLEKIRALTKKEVEPKSQ